MNIFSLSSIQRTPITYSRDKVSYPFQNRFICVLQPKYVLSSEVVLPVSHGGKKKGGIGSKVCLLNIVMDVSPCNLCKRI